MTSLFQVFVGLYHRVRGIDQNKEKTEEKTEEKSEPPEKKKNSTRGQTKQVPTKHTPR